MKLTFASFQQHEMLILGAWLGGSQLAGVRVSDTAASAARLEVDADALQIGDADAQAFQDRRNLEMTHSSLAALILRSPPRGQASCNGKRSTALVTRRGGTNR